MAIFGPRVAATLPAPASDRNRRVISGSGPYFESGLNTEGTSAPLPTPVFLAPNSALAGNALPPSKNPSGMIKPRTNFALFEVLSVKCLAIACSASPNAVCPNIHVVNA